jgi:hypothetical protein
MSTIIAVSFRFQSFFRHGRRLRNALAATVIDHPRFAIRRRTALRRLEAPRTDAAAVRESRGG